MGRPDETRRPATLDDVLIELERVRRAAERAPGAMVRRPSVARIAVGVCGGIMLYSCLVLVTLAVLVFTPVGVRIFKDFKTQNDADVRAIEGKIEAARVAGEQRRKTQDSHLTLHPEGPDGPAVPMPPAQKP